MSPSNSVLPLSISFIMFSCVPRGGLTIGSGCKFVVHVVEGFDSHCIEGFGLDLVEGFDFDLLEGFGFDLLEDFLVHYSHFLIRNQLKSK